MSKNIHYIYNVEYFEGLIQNGKDEKGPKFSLGNVSDPKSYSFITAKKDVDIENMTYFDLATSYPGLLMGTGYMHDLNSKDAAKCGFSFDFVTGLPYLPGSSLKGILRSYFPSGENDGKNSSKERMIVALLNKAMEPGDIEALRDDIFEYNDVFLDAYPVITCGDKLIENDYITPHRSPIVEPGSIHIIKVKPNVVFRFEFLLSDFKQKDKIVVTADEKRELFKKIILLMGVGAKTNVGFGRFCEINKMPKEKITPGTCRNCGKPTKMNVKTGKYYDLCFACNNVKNGRK